MRWLDPVVVVYISRLVPSSRTVVLRLGERVRYRGGGQDLCPIFSHSLCSLDGRGRSLRSFSTGGGVLEVRLARLAESVFDPTGGLAQLGQTAETFDISVAGCFSCLEVRVSDAAHPWDMVDLWRWQVRSPASGDVTRFRAISPFFCKPALFIPVP